MISSVASDNWDCMKSYYGGKNATLIGCLNDFVVNTVNDPTNACNYLQVSKASDFWHLSTLNLDALFSVLSVSKKRFLFRLAWTASPIRSPAHGVPMRCGSTFIRSSESKWSILATTPASHSASSLIPSSVRSASPKPAKSTDSELPKTIFKNLLFKSCIVNFCFVHKISFCHYLMMHSFYVINFSMAIDKNGQRSDKISASLQIAW